MTRSNRYIAWTCDEKVTNWEWSSTIFARRGRVATQQIRVSQVIVANAETSDNSFFASCLHFYNGANWRRAILLKLVFWAVLPVGAPQPSDIICNERTQIFAGKFTSTMTSRWRASFPNVSASSFPCMPTWEDPEKANWRPQIALYVC